VAVASPGPSSNAYPYRPSSHLVDISTFIPEGRTYRKGFLGTSGGIFRWRDGSRARFWGLNIANRNLWISRPEIDAVVEAVARSGANLVRFEALDSRGGILEIPGRPGTRHLDPAKLDTLQYWIAKLHQKSIHYYFDLIDFRDFAPEDGIPDPKVLGRAARPYAMFDPALIDLQKEYARELLTTINPYTHLRPVDDPGICNESGFFLYPKVTDNLVEPYRSNLQADWNSWLLQRYPTRQALSNSWKDALAPDEDAAAGSVRLPHLTRLDPVARQQDGVEYLTVVERRYFAEMHSYLRSIGLKIPITAVVSSDVPAELAAVATELDFTSENHYHDHPSFGGADWVGKYFHSNKNGLRDDNRFAFPPYTAQLRWNNKPVVIREWATVWPNRYRSYSIPEAAAYGRMQDIDGLLLFSYKTGESRDFMQEFGYQVDPTVWDLFGVGALAFLRGDVAAAEQIAVLEYGPDRLFRQDLGQSDLVRLAFWRRLACTVADGAAPVGDLTVWPLHPDKVDSADEVLRQSRTNQDTPALANGVYSSQNGQIRRDTINGRLMVATPRFCSVSGEFDATVQSAGSLTFETSSPVGSLVAVSLDNLPLTQSHHYLLQWVSVAENTGQSMPAAAPGAPAAFVVDQVGHAPVLTFGAPSARPTTVSLGRKQQLSVNMLNGSWEAVVEGNVAHFWCDTPGVNVTLLGRSFAARSEPTTIHLDTPVPASSRRESEMVVPTPVNLSNP
jgi:hypothetical protein